LKNLYSLDDQLVDAIFLSDVDDVRLLLEQGANPDTWDEEQQTPLMNATRDCNSAMVRILLEAGADPNLRDDDGWTALDVAVYRGTLDTVWLLIHYGADANAQNGTGRSVLLRAGLAAEDSTGVTDRLQRLGTRDHRPAGVVARTITRNRGLLSPGQDGHSSH
jgi:ankyrin repeat protein